MFAAIRTYGVTDIDELSELVKDGFLPIVESVPGFVAYYAVDAGDGMASSITICEDKTGVDESTSRASEWVEENALDFIESGPAVVTGVVTTETAAKTLAAIAGRAAQGPRGTGPAAQSLTGGRSWRALPRLLP